MSGPKGSKTNTDGTRTYYNPDTGARLISVTTINSILAKPALIPWAAKEAGKRAVNQIDELVEAVNAAKTEAARDNAAKWVASAYRDKSSRAAVRGTKIHDIADRKAKGLSVPDTEITDELRPYLVGYEKFMRDYRPEFLFTEESFINTTVGYGGAADFGAKMHGTFDEYVIGDWKTSASGPYLEWGYQLTAYAHSEATLVETAGPDGKPVYTRGPMPKVSQERAAVVRLLPNEYEVRWIRPENTVNMDVMWLGFRAAATLYKIKQAAGGYDREAFSS